MAVEHPHDTFYHGNIASGAGPLEQFKHRRVVAEPGVQVAAGHAAGHFMVGGVDIVGAGLEGLHLEAATGQRSHDAGGDGGLAHPAAHSRYYDGCGHFVSPVPVSRWLSGAHYTCRPSKTQGTVPGRELISLTSPDRGPTFR